MGQSGVIYKELRRPGDSSQFSPPPGLVAKK
jgi:hypothetical protein